MTFKELSKSNFKSIELNLPPLAEQRAIAAALRAAQAAVQARRRTIELERERKAALMQALFTRGTRGEPTKLTEIGEVPQGWEVVQLGSHCEFLQYGTSKFCDTDATGIPVLRIPNVIAGRVDISDLKYVKLPKKEADGLRLAVGDLIFVRTNGNREYTGRCAMFRGEPSEALFASYLIRARVKTEFFIPEFVQRYTMTAPGRSFLSGRSSNAADGKYNINTQTIRGVMIPLPPLAEQREIAEALRACDAVIAALEQEAALHEELFRALLEELMTGRVRVVSPGALVEP
ncbi:restriction endonuclease subunit S [Candidatus Chloroploca sp. M-50]|uniref:Restriction endonuclease subunit S n=1 Tax=Candidatus Chloroploca mongolica TaxID=2528176 RepID=A0ABS4DHU9_9CHLR|nr:restriction endonuclease subunit S [Candidatus Chloroploca mongolica]